MRVVLAEDNVLLRDGVTRILTAHKIDVVMAADADELTAAVEAELAAGRPVDVVLTDVRMPPTFTTEGLQAAISLRGAHPGLPTMVFSQYVEQLYARELLSDGDGAVGYLLKDRISEVGAFIASLRKVADGGTVIDPEVVSALLRRGRVNDPVSALTGREREVLALMAEGRSNSAIAEALVISQKAVDKHIGNIFTRLGLLPAADDNRRVLAVLAHLQSP